MSESTTTNANRRNSPRRQPKKASKFLCINGKWGLGKNVAVALLDVSESGIRLVVKSPIAVGNKIEIGLQAIGAHRPVSAPADVIWCIPLADGSCCIGARFEKLLNYAFLQEIAQI